jgi:hypothetical protein
MLVLITMSSAAPNPFFPVNGPNMPSMPIIPSMAKSSRMAWTVGWKTLLIVMLISSSLSVAITIQVIRKMKARSLQRKSSGTVDKHLIEALVQQAIQKSQQGHQLQAQPQTQCQVQHQGQAQGHAQAPPGAGERWTPL